jgi:hypothetical protein
MPYAQFCGGDHFRTRSMTMPRTARMMLKIA